ncbi:hypothetical protein JCM11491_001897 [Sporobolomyces phaffii]
MRGDSEDTKPGPRGRPMVVRDGQIVEYLLPTLAFLPRSHQHPPLPPPIQLFKPISLESYTEGPPPPAYDVELPIETTRTSWRQALRKFVRLVLCGGASGQG